jgi:MerR family copper efflux transcriptional regulator
MLIGELSKRTGFSRDTIRFYEKKGLIELPRKYRRENNYKEYSEQVLNRLLLIRTVKELGFTLNEIEVFFSRWDQEDASCEKLVFTLKDKMTQIDQQILKLQARKQRVTDSLTKCKNNDCEFEKTISLLHL